MVHYIGCDLGGTNIKAGIVDLESGSLISAPGVIDPFKGTTIVLPNLMGL
jgi:predicted NBD/HSP70 family sugar kinase